LAAVDKLDRIVAARMKLRQRFKDRIAATPALADEAPLGTGEANAHGMPRMPPGQTETHKWPVLDLGVKPDIAPEAWSMSFDGACAAPYSINFEELFALEQVEDTSDFHCVTSWSRFGIAWRGVRLADLIAAAEPSDDAEFVMCHGYDGYTTNLPLTEALKPDVLVAHNADGEPLPREHGGPVRIITPQLYAWKGAKWIKRVELMLEDRRGFWEERGYSNSAHPWRNDRYS
jgi:DMSO/TMAO reductase YedYZ molybdopterin-dependent catalytic subunit